MKYDAIYISAIHKYLLIVPYTIKDIDNIFLIVRFKKNISIKNKLLNIIYLYYLNNSE